MRAVRSQLAVCRLPLAIVRGSCGGLLALFFAAAAMAAEVPPTGGFVTDGPRDGDSAVTGGPVFRTLDDFSDPSRWTATASDQVGATLHATDGPDGKPALCLDYDFHGVSGYAVMRRELPTSHPAFFEYAFALRGDAPLNNFEIKLPDASGDNVWWVNRPNWPVPREWTEVRLKERHFSFAWGPTTDKTLRDTRYFELTISAGREGGKGRVCLADLRFRERAAPSAVPPAVRALSPDDEAIPAVVDGDPSTTWVSGEGAWPLRIDLGETREFGGLTLRWLPGSEPQYHVDVSDDGTTWRRLRTVAQGDGGEDLLPLPESEARWIRIDAEEAGDHRGLADVVVHPLAWAGTPNAFLANVAAAAPRGAWPRGFVGEQPVWTLVGIDGGREHGLLGEDGAIEVGRGAFSIEPFVEIGGQRVSWADVETTQSLQDGYLPIPTARWSEKRFTLDIIAFARGSAAASQLFGSYRLTNTGRERLVARLALVARPLQVNAPKQFLSTPGGISPIHDIAVSSDRIVVSGRAPIRALTPVSAVSAATFDGGGALAAPASIEPATVHDDTGLASGAWFFDVELQPGEHRDFAWVSPLTGELPIEPVDVHSAQGLVARQWREKLNHATFRVPAEGQRIVDTLRTSLAHMLISRVGPRLQPGTRSYARAWIRDGAMIGEGLLRMGRADVAAEFLDFYAPYQFDSGKVPCCVDDRGADPVPENDSHGQLVYAIAELYRYTGDDAMLRRYWPNVQGAVRYMDELRRSERTGAVKAATPAHYGLMPASISHEGYSAKPMHSYWDDFWALRGYKDAVQIARWLGEEADAKTFAASRDEFAADLYASIGTATKQHGIDFIPGAAELGDFDATSTTIALSPGGEHARLPQPLLTNTFERYWREFVARRDGKKDWDFYTPYELRTVGTFVRLGWRERAHEALDFFFADRQPPGWNQWAEVVSRTPREPFFVGDLPHAWVESDYVRSALDLFAYEEGEALVLAAGIPAAWLDPAGGNAVDVGVAGLRTPWGEVAYDMVRDGDALRVDVRAGAEPPGGRYLTWSFESPPGTTTIDGKAATWHRDRLPIPPGDVRVEIATE